MTAEEYEVCKRELIVAEFSSLREELLKRAEFQHRLVNLTLVAAGAFVSFRLGNFEGPLGRVSK